MNRQRRDGFVTSDKSQNAADLLWSVVCHLDAGKPAFELADDVQAIAGLMRK